MLYTMGMGAMQMKYYVLPKTKWGILSAVLFAAQVLFVAYFFVMTGVFHQTGGDTFFSNLNLALPMLAAWGAGVVSFVMALITILLFKSRAVLLYCIMPVTFLTSLYGVMEILP